LTRRADQCIAQHFVVRDSVHLDARLMVSGTEHLVIPGGLVALLTLPNTRHILPVIKWYGSILNSPAACDTKQ
jgi:hypothetical protein